MEEEGILFSFCHVAVSLYTIMKVAIFSQCHKPITYGVTARPQNLTLYHDSALHLPGEWLVEHQVNYMCDRTVVWGLRWAGQSGTQQMWSSPPAASVPQLSPAASVDVMVVLICTIIKSSYLCKATYPIQNIFMGRSSFDSPTNSGMS